MKKIRIWKLGDHKNGVMPTKESFDKLEEAIRGLQNGGSDLMWDSLLSIETYEVDDNTMEIIIKDVSKLEDIVKLINLCKTV